MDAHTFHWLVMQWQKVQINKTELAKSKSGAGAGKPSIMLLNRIMHKVHNVYGNDWFRAQSEVCWRPTVSHWGGRVVAALVGERVHGKACRTTTYSHPFHTSMQLWWHSVLNSSLTLLCMQSCIHCNTHTHTPQLFCGCCVQMSD